MPTPISCHKSPTVSLFCYIPAAVSYPRSPVAPPPRCVPAIVSHSGSFAILSYCCLPAPAVSAVFSLLCYASISYCRISALLLLLPIFGSSPFLGSLPLKTFKQFLSYKFWLYMSTSLAMLLCLFPALGVYNLDDNNCLYNLINNNKRKRSFDTMFINSHPLANNYDQKEVNLSFGGCRCPDAVKLNRLW